jgi:hypothetical protein
MCFIVYDEICCVLKWAESSFFVCAGSEPTTPFNLFIGNLNPNKSVNELKFAISELFAKNDLAVVDVRTGTNR